MGLNCRLQRVSVGGFLYAGFLKKEAKAARSLIHDAQLASTLPDAPLLPNVLTILFPHGII
jgi:hypothetical protein